MTPTRLVPSLWVLLTAALAPAAEPAVTLDLGEGVRLEMVLVKKGTFQQGSLEKELGRGDDEKQRQVTLTNDFYLGKFPVTRGQFARFVKETGYRTDAEKGGSGGFGFDGVKLVQRKEFTWLNPGFRQTDDHPVTLVTYDDARAFADWLSKKTRRTITLPTEAQWEYACRAGTSTRFANGDTEDDLKAIAWYQANAGAGTHPVGQKKANVWGLHDMSGNVWQWCRDWYGPYVPGPVDDPEEARNNLSDLPRRVLRGGSWLRESRHCRSAARYRNTPGSRNADNGFRIAAGVAVKAGAAQPAVPAPQTPTRSEGPNERVTHNAGLFGSSEGALCVFLIPLAFLFLIWLLRRLSQASTFEDRTPAMTKPSPSRPPFRPRVVNDGFWLDTARLAANTVVRYRYRSGGQTRTGTVSIQPGPKGQFVYTGNRPDEIEVLDVMPQESSDDPQPIDRSFDAAPAATPPPERSEPTPSFTGFPSAY